MKKSLVALAALSAISAFADVDVSGGIKLYGVLDQAYTKQATNSAFTTPRTDSGVGFFQANANSRFGVKGERDLGEGLKGFIQVEAELQAQDKTSQFSTSRGTFVGLKSHDVGTVKAGYQESLVYEADATDANGRVEYKPQVWRMTATVDRTDNAIRYTSPSFSGFSVDYQRGGIKAAPTAPKGIYTAYGVNYAKDALLVRYITDSTTATALAPTLYGDPFAGVLTTSGKAMTLSAVDYDASLNRNVLAATYDFGSFKLNYLMSNVGQAGAKGGSLNTNTIGVKIPYEKYTFALSWGVGNYATNSTNTTTVASGSISDTTIGAYYNFDKSTQLYFLGSMGKNKVDNAGTGNSSNFTSGTSGSTTTTAIGLRFNF